MVPSKTSIKKAGDLLKSMDSTTPANDVVAAIALIPHWRMPSIITKLQRHATL